MNLHRIRKQWALIAMTISLMDMMRLNNSYLIKSEQLVDEFGRYRHGVHKDSINLKSVDLIDIVKTSDDITRKIRSILSLIQSIKPTSKDVTILNVLVFNQQGNRLLMINEHICMHKMILPGINAQLAQLELTIEIEVTVNIATKSFVKTVHTNVTFAIQQLIVGDVLTHALIVMIHDISQSFTRVNNIEKTFSTHLMRTIFIFID